MGMKKFFHNQRTRKRLRTRMTRMTRKRRIKLQNQYKNLLSR
jgi:hypothetical protein